MEMHMNNRRATLILLTGAVLGISGRALAQRVTGIDVYHDPS